MTKKLRGDRPPPRIPQPGERLPVSFRVDPTLKRALDQASEAMGVSLMNYCEGALRRSLDFEAAFGGPQATAFWRMIAADVLVECGADWLFNPKGILDAADVTKARFRAMQPRFDDCMWMVAVAQRATDAFERDGRSASLAVARSAINFSYELGEPRHPQLVPWRDRVRDNITGYEQIMADYQAETGQTELSPALIAAVDQEKATRHAKAAQSTDPSAPKPEPAPAPASKPTPPLMAEPPEGENRPRTVHIFEAAWGLAAKLALVRIGPEPTSLQIAEIFADDPELMSIVELPAPQTAAAILAYREVILRVQQFAVVPKAGQGKNAPAEAPTSDDLAKA